MYCDMHSIAIQAYIYKIVHAEAFKIINNHAIPDRRCGLFLNPSIL